MTHSRNMPPPNGKARILIQTEGKVFNYEFDESLAGAMIKKLTQAIDEHMQELSQMHKDSSKAASSSVSVAHPVDEDPEPASRKTKSFIRSIPLGQISNLYH